MRDVLEAPTAHDSLLLFVVVPAVHPSILRETLGSIRAQSTRQWRCVVIEESFTDDVGAVVDEFVDCAGRLSVVHAKEPVAEAMDQVVRDAVEHYAVVVEPGHLLAVDFARRMLRSMEQEPNVSVVTCDVLGPDGVRLHHDAGPMTLERYLSCPLVPTAAIIRMGALRDTIGRAGDLKYHTELWRALWLLRTGQPWLHIDEPLVVSRLRTERVSLDAREARAYSLEADSVVWGTLAASSLGTARMGRLMRDWLDPEYGESVRTKRRLWLRMASRGQRGAIRDAWRHRVYFSPRMRFLVMTVAVLPSPLRRALARYAYARMAGI